jgi:hypothetical protein
MAVVGTFWTALESSSSRFSASALRTSMSMTIGIFDVVVSVGLSLAAGHLVGDDLVDPAVAQPLHRPASRPSAQGLTKGPEALVDAPQKGVMMADKVGMGPNPRLDQLGGYVEVLLVGSGACSSPQGSMAITMFRAADMSSAAPGTFIQQRSSSRV